MATKIALSIEEIARHSVAPYTVYNKNGDVICYKGVVLTPKLVSLLSMHELYRNAYQVTENDNSDDINNECIISRISSKTTSYLIDITKQFLNAAESGDSPNRDTFFQARDRILEEVKQHIDSIQHIGELRVYDDDYNLSHGINVSTLSTALAIKLNYQDQELQEITLGGLLHDIGKAKLPKQIINKPGRLTEKEFEIVKLHAPLGYKIIKQEYQLSDNVALSARDHQERYDGSGYVRGLAADQIFKHAQIITVADSYDAAASDKSYACAKKPRDIIKELLQNSKKFHPRVLYTLVHLVNYNTGTLKENITSV
ncbi:MAG: HD domain-containing phosphohydrolase [Cyanobacteriota bacterium]